MKTLDFSVHSSHLFCYCSYCAKWKHVTKIKVSLIDSICVIEIISLRVYYSICEFVLVSQSHTEQNNSQITIGESERYFLVHTRRKCLFGVRISNKRWFLWHFSVSFSQRAWLWWWMCVDSLHFLFVSFNEATDCNVYWAFRPIYQSLISFSSNQVNHSDNRFRFAHTFVFVNYRE